MLLLEISCNNTKQHNEYNLKAFKVDKNISSIIRDINMLHIRTNLCYYENYEIHQHL